MNTRLIYMICLIEIISCGLSWSSPIDKQTESQSSNLTIYLPREVALETNILTLDKVAVITGEPALAAKAGEIELGKFSTAEQVITIDKSLILSRIACSGIPNCNPILTGAEKVFVRQKAAVINADIIAEKAKSLLTDTFQNSSIAKWEILRMPADVTLLAGNTKIELIPRLVSQSNGQAIIEVKIMAGGKQLEIRQIVFRAKYNVKRVVLTTDVQKGGILKEENTKIEEVTSDEPQAANWSVPFGYVTNREMPAGTVVTSNAVKPPKPSIVIERNQNVLIKIERGGLVVSAMGKAVQQGKPGECIKVKNNDSQRVILAKVNDDGSVEPVF